MTGEPKRSMFASAAPWSLAATYIAAEASVSERDNSDFCLDELLHVDVLKGVEAILGKRDNLLDWHSPSLIVSPFRFFGDSRRNRGVKGAPNLVLRCRRIT